MDTKRILYITQEITPYLPESESSRICRYLPQGIQDLGRETRTFMPRYGAINERRNQLHEVIRLSGMNLIIDDTDHPLIIKVASIQAARMQVYFIDNEDFFDVKATDSDGSEEDLEDNGERAIFYVRGVLETVKKLRWIPDLVHCHGWLSVLTPVYLKRKYADDPGLSNAKVVYSIYEDTLNSSFSKGIVVKIKQDGMSDRDLSLLKTATDYETLTCLAIQYSDGIIQGSSNISERILDFIDKKKKPFLPYQPEDTYIDKYNEFYDMMLNNKSKSGK